MIEAELPRVQIYILSRNRSEYLLQCLDSCEAVTYKNFEIVVSENSTDGDTRKILNKSKFAGRIKVHHRNNLEFCDHINTVIEEVTAPYFMIFHDDDLLLPNCLEDYMRSMKENPTVAAVAGNSYFIFGDRQTREVFCNQNSDTAIKTKQEFINNYFTYKQSHPAFPAYIYRTDKVKTLRISKNEGRGHSDTTFLFKVMSAGGLFWTSAVTTYYRVHGENMSSVINMRAVDSMIRFFLKKAPEFRTEILTYKYLNRLKFYIRDGVHQKMKLLQSKHKKVFCRAVLFLLGNPSGLMKRFFPSAERQNLK